MIEYSRMTHPAFMIGGRDRAASSVAPLRAPVSHLDAGFGRVSHSATTHAVTNGVCVTYRLNGGAEQTGLISTRARADLVDGVIPLTSPLGVALSGLRIGMHAPLACEDGSVGSVTLVRIEVPA